MMAKTLIAGRDRPLAGRPLRELASIVRSKNAGPYRITFDILFDDAETFRAVAASKAITRESVAALYGVPGTRISSIYEIPKANAIKFTIVRPIAQCAVGETDVYGAQQHAPLLDIQIPLRGHG